jgi:hypothetical protein
MLLDKLIPATLSHSLLVWYHRIDERKEIIDSFLRLSPLLFFCRFIYNPIKLLILLLDIDGVIVTFFMEVPWETETPNYLSYALYRRNSLKDRVCHDPGNTILIWIISIDFITIRISSKNIPTLITLSSMTFETLLVLMLFVNWWC